MKGLISCLLSAALLCAAPAGAQTTVAGVQYQEAAEVPGGTLRLNGAGIRYKLVFKVYTAGLYLPKKAATPEEVLALPGPKRVSLTMLREVEAAEFGKAFTMGIEDNHDQAALSRLAASVLRVNQIFAQHKQLQPGDTVAIDWIPGTGTLLTLKGVAQGEPLKDPEFYNALLRIWLGAKPADGRLKDALLGKAG